MKPTEWHEAKAVDEAQAELTVAEVVTVLTRQHVEVRRAGGDFSTAVRSVGARELGQEGVALVRRYDDFARGLAFTIQGLEQAYGRWLQRPADRLEALGATLRTLLEEVELRRIQLLVLEQTFPSVHPALQGSLSAFVSSVQRCLRTTRDLLGGAPLRQPTLN